MASSCSLDGVRVLAVGSGSLAAMAVFEDGYKPNMEVSTVFLYRHWLLVVSPASVRDLCSKPKNRLFRSPGRSAYWIICNATRYAKI